MRTRLNRCATPLLFASGVAPLAILLGWGSSMPILAFWPLVYFLAACLCLQLPGKARLGTGIALAVGMMAGSVVWFISAMQPSVLLVGIGHGVLLLVTLSTRNHVTQVSAFTGVSIHLLAQLFLNLMAEERRLAVYGSAQVFLTISLMIFLATALLLLNGLSLASALPEAQAVPLSIRRRNRALTWLMLVSALLISLIPALGRLLAAAWDWLRTAISRIIRWLMALVPDQLSGGGTGDASMDMTSLGESAPPSTLVMWLEKILLAVATALAILLLVIALRKLAAKLAVLLRWLFQRLQSYAASAAEDYVDETQDTRTQGEERFSLAKLRRRRISARELDALPPRERIRRRYGLARAKHPEWAQSQTARETLPEASATVYERARYSSHEITEADAEKFAP